MLRLHRPEKRNVLGHAAKQQLVAALRDADADDGVRAVVLTGGPTDFVAGTDVDEMQHLTSADHLVSRTGEVFEVPEGLSTLTVSAVEGFALAAASSSRSRPIWWWPGRAHALACPRSGSA